jgi:hypothetical protein
MGRISDRGRRARPLDARPFSFDASTSIGCCLSRRRGIAKWRRRSDQKYVPVGAPPQAPPALNSLAGLDCFCGCALPKDAQPTVWGYRPTQSRAENETVGVIGRYVNNPPETRPKIPLYHTPKFNSLLGFCKTHSCGAKWSSQLRTRLTRIPRGRCVPSSEFSPSKQAFKYLPLFAEDT